jgi:hypothetical protein
LVEHSLGKGEVTGSIPVIGSSKIRYLYELRSRLAFEKALIAVQKVEQYEALRGVIERVFARERVEGLLRTLASSGIPVRKLESMLDRKVFEDLDQQLAKSGQSARGLFDALTPSDQGQLREFYLSTLESVDNAVREKYAKVYRYY